MILEELKQEIVSTLYWDYSNESEDTIIFSYDNLGLEIEVTIGQLKDLICVVFETSLYGGDYITIEKEFNNKESLFNYLKKINDMTENGTLEEILDELTKEFKNKLIQILK